MGLRTYSVNHSAAVSTAITVFELTAPATMALVVLRAWMNQESSTTSAQTAIQLSRKTATVTGTAFTPLELETGGPAATATAKRTATAEGTDGDVLIREGFNVLNGWLYLPVPEERILVPPSGMLALKFPVAPPNVTYDYGVVFAEIG